MRVSLEFVSIPLPLGMPPSREEPRGLLDALLTRRCIDLDDVAAGSGGSAAEPMMAPPIVSAEVAEKASARDVVVALDATEEPPAPSGRRPGRYQVDCAPGDLDDLLAITLPAPLVVYSQVDDAALADTARRLTEAGHIPGLPAGHGADAVADFLAVLAHAETGYAARATSADEIVALLAATVAALMGVDIRAALAAPDVARLRRLNPEAAAAVREVLLFVEVDDLLRVRNELQAFDLVAS